MRRIGRWMLNALTVLSLLLCVGTCVLWVRSYCVADMVYRHGLTSQSEIGVSEGALGVGWMGVPSEEVSWERLQSHPMPIALGLSSKPDVELRCAGAVYLRGVEHPTLLFLTAVAIPYRFVLVPMWMLAAAFAVLPATRFGFWARARKAARRKRAGHCIACGYDLHGNVSGVCPECGAKIPMKAGAA